MRFMRPAQPPGDDPSRSPALLPRLPRRGPGVRRLNRVPIWVFAGGVCAVVLAVGWTYRARLQGSASAIQDAQRKPTAGATASVLDGAPRSGEIKAATFRIPGPPAGPLPAPAPAAASPRDQGQAGGADDLATQARKQAWAVYFQQVAELQRNRLEAAQQAMRAETSPAASGGPGGAQQAPGSGLPQQIVQAQADQLQAQQAAAGASPGLLAPGGLGGIGLGGGLPIHPPAGPDPSGAREKIAFTNQRGNLGQDDTLLATVRDPISPYLVTAGDSIPCVSVTGENSDAPGQFVGRVSRNIYDSATGQILLIPQGAKVVGTYDTIVTNGQARIPTVITRIIFPDTSSISIGAMPAADQSGFAGLHDKVDRHLWEKFGNAVIIGIASAGIQVSQGTGQTFGYSSQQIGAAALGQQLGQLGQEFARSGLSIPNTITVRPGYPFVVQVTKDLLLRPYVDRRTIGAQSVNLGPVLQ